MRRTLSKAGLLLYLVIFASSGQAAVVEPSLHLPKTTEPAPRVALTLDLCMGDADHRILDTLISEKIKATLFVTGRWIKRNAAAIAQIKRHPDLFEIANHGANHIPAIDNQPEIYGLKTAGSLKAVCEEVEGGEQALTDAGFLPSTWYRDASAVYSPDAINLIKAMGYRVAGFSLNADVGASLPAAQVADRIAKAVDGDVIIAHMNQPNRPSGRGVVAGIISLKKRGFNFVTLSGGMNSKSAQNQLKVSCAEIFAKTQ